MIQKETKCLVIDNSGALEAKVFGFYKQPVNREAKVLSKRGNRHEVTGGLVKVAIRKVEPNRNIKKGNVYKAIITGTKRKEKKASEGIHVKRFVNTVVLVNDALAPVGTSVKGLVSSKVSIGAIKNMSGGVI